MRGICAAGAMVLAFMAGTAQADVTGAGLAGAEMKGAELAGSRPPADCNSAQFEAASPVCAMVYFDQAERDLKDALAAARLRMRTIDQGQPADQRSAEAALQASEMAWVAYRDLGCSAEGLSLPAGAPREPAIMACKARMTASRSMDLWRISGGP